MTLSTGEELRRDGSLILELRDFDPALAAIDLERIASEALVPSHSYRLMFRPSDTFPWALMFDNDRLLRAESLQQLLVMAYSRRERGAKTGMSIPPEPSETD